VAAGVKVRNDDPVPVTMDLLNPKSIIWFKINNLQHGVKDY